MTRFSHDQFAKDYLEDLLAPFGEVKAPRRVSGEMREIDVWFAPKTNPPANLEPLGLLGQLAQTPALFEPFRNAATVNEIRQCLLKLLTLQGECLREAKRKQQTLLEEQLPQLWILSPTASKALLDSFRAKIEASWGPGIHLLGRAYRTGIVAIHQLPLTTETLWIRLLGRGRVQDQALEELAKLPPAHPLCSNALQFLTNLRADLQAKKTLNTEEQSLIMKLSPLYVQWEQEATQRGMQQGVQQERRAMVESMLEVRFGTLDETLAALVEPLSQLSAKEAAQAVLQLSREELLARFVEEQGRQGEKRRQRERET